MTDFEDDYRALRQGVGALFLPKDFLRVHGPETFAYLQGQLSQDVAQLAVGAAVDSFLLQPQGKVDALVRVIRTGEEEAVVEVDAGFGQSVLGRLTRFKLRVKAEVEALSWKCLAIRGPQARSVPAEGGLVLDADWPGLTGIDVLGPEPEVPEGARQCGLEAWEAVRIEAGIPKMGAELDERTIPAEAGIVERAVSFTKGCYTGQELVARIDSRGGNVPRRLRGVVFDGDELPGVGSALVVEGREVGALTSSAPSPGREAFVGLAYVRRDVEPPAGAEVRGADDRGAEVSLPARIEALPLVQ